MPAERSPELLLADLQRVNSLVSGVPSASDYRKHGEYGVSTFYRHFDGFKDAREQAGITGEVQTGPSDEELIEDLRRVDSSLEKTVSTNDYKEEGEYAPNTILRRFGGFTEARKAAGIEGDPNSEPRLSDEELFEDVRRVYEKLGEPPSEYQYREHGAHAFKTLRKRFGPIRDIREAAGIPNPDKRGRHNKIAREKLIEAIHDLAEQLDRIPRREDMQESGPYSGGPYRNEFNTWNGALRAAGFEPIHEHNKERQEYECEVCGTVENRLESDVPESGRVFCSPDCVHEYLRQRPKEENPQYNPVTVECANCGAEKQVKRVVAEKKENHFCNYDCYGDWCSEHRTGGDHPRWKGGGEFYYGPNWRTQRRKRLEYDGYECQRCGISKAESLAEFGQKLEVHHRKPVREHHEQADGDPDWEQVNALDNLVTLCIRCHRKVEKLPVRPEFD